LSQHNDVWEYNGACDGLIKVGYLHVPLKISMAESNQSIWLPTCWIQLPSPPLASVTAHLMAAWEALCSFLLPSLHNSVVDALEKGWNCCKGWLGPLVVWIATGLLQDNQCPRLNLKYLHHNYLGCSCAVLVLPCLPHGSPSPLAHRLFYWLSQDVHMWAPGLLKSIQ